MRMTADELRAKMASLSGDELRAVQAAPDGEYIPEAREAAAEELRLRGGGAEPQEAQESAAPATAPRSPQWFRAWHSVQHRWIALRDRWRRIPREGLPRGLRTLFWISLLAALAWAAQIVLTLAGVGGYPQAGSRVVLGFLPQQLCNHLIGVLGLILVYGVCTERTYPRWLGAGALVVISAVGLVDQLRAGVISSDLITYPIVAWSSVRYLLQNEDVIDYYFRVRNGASRRLVELRPGESVAVRPR
jgi:hypothetical protein